MDLFAVFVKDQVPAAFVSRDDARAWAAEHLRPEEYRIIPLHVKQWEFPPDE